MFSTAEHFVERLTEVEKATIRGAAVGQLDWLFYNIHQHEFKLDQVAAKSVFDRACSLVNDQFSAYSTQTGFGKTWRF